MNKGAYILLIVCLGFFPSCSKKNKNKQDAIIMSNPAYFVDQKDLFENEMLIEKREQHFNKRKRYNLSNQFDELSNKEIPYMIDAHSIKQHDMASHTRLEYYTQYIPAEITSFYEQEMEFLGWEKLFFYQEEQEFLMVFTKPHKSLVIIGKIEKNKYKVLIYTDKIIEQ
ncbi:MAG: hypothetical protein ACOYT8_03150 [Candidatus Dependentiae bacterium]